MRRYYNVTCAKCGEVDAEYGVVWCEDGEYRCHDCCLDSNFNPDTGEVNYPDSDEYHT